MIKIVAVLFTLGVLVSCGEQPESKAPSGLTADSIADLETVVWGKPRKELQCSIHLANNVVTPTSPRELVLRVRNYGDTSARYHIDNCDGPTYKIIASWPNGKLLDFSDLEQQEHYPHGITNWISLKAGQINQHTLAIRITTFARDKYLFIGSELGASLEQDGEIILKLKLLDIESNSIKLTVNR